MATPSPVCVLVAELETKDLSANILRKQVGGQETRHLPNDTVCALSQLLGHVVSLIHNKILIEDLEDLAAL